MADDARTVIRNLLTQYGLADLVPWAMNKLTSGASGDQVRLEMRDQPAYRQRFRAIFEREQRGLPPISADYVLEYERQRSSLLRAYGLPSGFYDQPDDAVRDLVNDVSVAELQTRVVSGFARLQATDPAVRDEFQRQNNLTDGQLAAFFLDPDRALPIIKQAVTTAEIGAAARTTGFGAISTSEATRLSTLGVDAEEALSGFQSLRRLEPVVNAAIEGGPMSREAQLEAVFGDDPTQRQSLERRIGVRRAIGESSAGSFATDREGFAGIGTA